MNNIREMHWLNSKRIEWVPGVIACVSVLDMDMPLFYPIPVAYSRLLYMLTKLI